jgi:hypothetical protein
VVGASAPASRRASRGRKPSSTPARSTGRPASAAGSRARRTNGATSRAGGVNRDGLLRSLFPTGIPASEDAIRSVNRWLDEAERLARLK